MSYSKKTLTLFCVVSWYVTNIGILLLNKLLLSKSFRQPVSLTTCHMLACSIIGYLASYLNYFPLQKLASKQHFFKVFTLSTIFCTTITLGNASLRYIPLSFNQAIGATTPFFTALVAFLLEGTVERLETYLALLPVVLGIAIASGGEPSFHILGFTFCILSASGRALKTVVQGILIKDPSEKLDPMSLLLYMSFFSFVILVPSVIILEPGSFALARELAGSSQSFLPFLVIGSFMAYLVNLLNFLVTKYTSPLTLQVLGNAKGVVAAFISVLMFKNVVTAQGIFGYALTMAGVFLYAHNKRKSRIPSSLANVALKLLSLTQDLVNSSDDRGHAGLVASAIRAEGHASTVETLGSTGGAVVTVGNIVERKSATGRTALDSQHPGMSGGLSQPGLALPGSFTGAVQPYAATSASLDLGLPLVSSSPRGGYDTVASSARV